MLPSFAPPGLSLLCSHWLSHVQGLCTAVFSVLAVFHACMIKSPQDFPNSQPLPHFPLPHALPHLFFLRFFPPQKSYFPTKYDSSLVFLRGEDLSVLILAVYKADKRQREGGPALGGPRPEGWLGKGPRSTSELPLRIGCCWEVPF